MGELLDDDELEEMKRHNNESLMQEKVRLAASITHHICRTGSGPAKVSPDLRKMSPWRIPQVLSKFSLCVTSP